MIGGGNKKFGPCMVVSLYGDKRVVLNTLCTFHMGGSQMQYVSSDDRTCEISKGPCHLGDSFLEG